MIDLDMSSLLKNEEKIEMNDESTKEDIAIIGMAVSLPGADSIEEFWKICEGGIECVGDFPENRKTDADNYLSFIGKENYEYLKGAYINEIDKFDYRFFGISPKEANLMNPNQRLFLQKSWELMESSGYGGAKLAGSKTGVYVGYISDLDGYKYREIINNTENTFDAVAVLGNLASMLPSRISYLLDLKGPTMMVDTACSSSLVAIHLACEGIQNGSCDMAIAGGIRINVLPLETGVSLGIESSNGRTGPFDDSSDGTGFGEGAAMVFLKPLSKAKKDSDTIYAVIKGSAVNQDGTSAGITAPNALSQANVIVDAWKNADIDPETISYIEAHGTGTKLGDPIEIDGIQRAFSKFTDKKQFCAIGSVKSNIGHLFDAAGAAGLIKAVLSLKNKKIPPTINYHTPNRNINFPMSPVYVNDVLRTWETNDSPRRCGVSSFGFSGTNCHIVLEEAPDIMPEADEVRYENAGIEILCLSAKTKNSLNMLLLKYKEFLAENGEIDIKDISYTANTARGHYNYRTAVIAKNRKELAEKIDILIENEISGNESAGIYSGEHFINTSGKKSIKDREITTDEKNKLNDELAEAVNKNAVDDRNTGYFEKIGRLYVSGADIDWRHLYKTENRNNVLIPAYQFEKTRCWIDIPQRTVREKAPVNIETSEKQSKTQSVTLNGRDDAAYTDIEENLGEIFGKALGLNEINIYDGFYEIGGDSISLMEVVTNIKNKFGCTISFNSFVDKSSIFDVSQLINVNEEVSEGVNYPQWKPDTESMYMPFPLTDVQVAYLTGRDDRFELGGVATHIYLEYKTIRNIEKLNASLRKVIDRHPMLRTVFLSDGQQKILENIPEYNMEVIDISYLSSYKQEKYILEERAKSSHKVFNPYQWPLFEFKAFKLSENTSHLFVDFDMLIADGTSLQIIGKELMDFYNKPEFILPELDFTFRDYMMAYEEFKTTKTYYDDREYWLSKIDGFPQPPSLPLKNAPSEIGIPHFKRYEKNIEKDKWDAIKKTAQKKNISASAVVFTAYAKVLAFWSNKQSVALNLTVFNRYPFHKEINKLIGDFTSILLIGAETKSSSFWENAAEIQKTMMEALEHRHYDGVEFIREISKINSFGNKAVMPVVFTSMLFNSGDNSIDGLMELGNLAFALSQTPQVYLDSQAYETKGNLTLTWDFVEQLFDENVITAMFDQYTNIISGLLEPDEYKMEAPHRDMEFIEKYNNTDEAIPASKLHKLFMETVNKFPGRIAVEYEAEQLTYSELNLKSNQVAHYLKSIGIGRNDFVAVLAKRNPNTIINIMGILKSGAAYVPVEPEYPQGRKDYIVQNSNSRLIMEPDFYENEKIENFPDTDIDFGNADDTAYVIYTSGSTGMPKGVVITHSAAANTVIDINQKFKVSENDRILGISSMCFDLSVYDIFGALSTGAALVMIPDQREVRYLIDAVENKNITVWNSVPAIMNMLVENIDLNKGGSGLRLVMLSGDWIPLTLPPKIKECFSKADIISLGGATEASIWSIYYPVKEIQKNWKSIPYGIPLANQKFYVLDSGRELCPLGVQGELYIGGIGVAKGYMQDEEKTKAAFINHKDLGGLYKTGDYGILHNDGYIEFLGRKDSQVKIRGYRIELGEIEKCLSEHNSVKNSVVIDVVDKNKKKYLCAYIVPEQENIDIPELRNHLMERIPEYMIPAQFVNIEEIPLTSNGKIDRKALPNPEEYVQAGIEYKAPEGEIEEKLAKLWERILQINTIGAEDEFYALGGDSLKATSLAQGIRKEFETEISLRELLDNKTIRSIAKLIENAEKSDSKTNDSNLTLLKKGTDKKKNIFFVHSGSGEAETYTALCNGINGRYYCWGIKSDRFEDAGPKNVVIEEIAKRYLRKILKVQNNGPFYLAGWCTGGTIAFEIARQLELLGEKVEFLGLISTGAVQMNLEELPQTFSAETEKSLINKLLSIPEIRESVNKTDTAGQVWEAVLEYALNNKQEENIINLLLKIIPAGIQEAISDFKNGDIRNIVYYLNVIRTYERADLTYIPASKTGVQVSFFKAKDDGTFYENSWNGYCEKPMDVFYLDGDHFSIFGDKNIMHNSKVFHNVLA